MVSWYCYPCEWKMSMFLKESKEKLEEKFEQQVISRKLRKRKVNSRVFLNFPFWGDAVEVKCVCSMFIQTHSRPGYYKFSYVKQLSVCVMWMRLKSTVQILWWRRVMERKVHLRILGGQCYVHGRQCVGYFILQSCKEQISQEEYRSECGSSVVSQDLD